MKLILDRQENIDSQGNGFYQAFAKLSFSPKELQTVLDRQLKDCILIGGDSDTEEGCDCQVEAIKVLWLCELPHITIESLFLGVTARVFGWQELPLLEWFEDTLQERCRSFDVVIATAESHPDCPSQQRGEKTLSLV